MNLNYFDLHKEFYRKATYIDSHGVSVNEGDIDFQDDWFDAWLLGQVKEAKRGEKYFELVYNMLWAVRPKYIPMGKRFEILENPQRMKSFYDTRCGNHWQEHWPLFLTHHGLVGEADWYYEAYSWEAIHEKMEGEK